MNWVARVTWLTASLFVSTSTAVSQQAASVSGIVRHSMTSDPIPNVKVSLADRKPVATDEKGRFHLNDLTPGQYTIQVEKEGYTFGELYGGVHISVSEGEQVKNLTIPLSPEAVLTGQVVDPTGMPVSAMLSLTSASDQRRVAFGYSTATGEFRIAKVPPGEFLLEASLTGPNAALLPTYYPASTTSQSASTVRVSAGEHIANLKVVMQPVRLSVVKGRFTGEIPQQGNADITAERATRLSGTIIPSARVSPDGSFSLSLPDGNYKLKVALLRREDRPMVIGLQDISVAGAPVVDVIIPPAPLRTVRTRIQWTVTGRPVPPDITVMFNPLERNGYMQFAKRSDSGELEATLSPDRYSVLLGKLPPGAYVKSLSVANSSIVQSGLDLLTGTATDVDAVLADDGGTVAALVTGGSPQPIQGGIFWLSRDSSNQAELQFYSRSTACNIEGICTLTGVAPGEYKASIRVDQRKSVVQTIRVTPNSQQRLRFMIP